MLESTLVLVKPDAVRRALIGAIVQRLEARGLLIRGLRSFVFSEELVQEHCAHIADQPFFPEYAAYLQSGMTVALWVSGLEAIPVVRRMIGETNGRNAAPGTIRGDYSVSNQRNLVHASDSPETAAIELARFFPDGPSAPEDTSRFPPLYSVAEVA